MKRIKILMKHIKPVNKSKKFKINNKKNMKKSTFAKGELKDFGDSKILELLITEKIKHYKLEFCIFLILN